MNELRNMVVYCCNDDWGDQPHGTVFPVLGEKLTVESYNVYMGIGGLSGYYTFYEMPADVGYSADHFKELDLNFAEDILSKISKEVNL